MENHFYHIKWPPLNVTIFITHVRNVRNGSYANEHAYSSYFQKRNPDIERFDNKTRAAVDGTPSQIPAFLPITFTLGSRSQKM